MAVKKGTLSIDSENIFPIIKKWVYSDHDIFCEGTYIKWLRCGYEAEKA